MSVQAMAAPPKQHLAWLDIVKGAGISMVVLGHISNVGFMHFFVYVFHMPLFFFVSGFLHRVDARFGSYARKKTITLMVPYFTFLLIVTLLDIPHFLKHPVTIPRIAHAAYVLAWGGKMLQGVYGVFWFLSCLYLTQQVMNYLLAKFSIRVVAATVTAGLFLAYVNYLVFPQLTLPYDANVVLAAAPFYFVGHLLRGKNTLDWRLSVFALVCVGVVSLLIARGAPAYGSAAYMDMKDNAYGMILVTYLLALGCIVGTLQLAQLLPSQSAVGRALSKLGLVSLPIMFLHAEILNGHTAILVRRYGTAVAFTVTLGVSWCVAELMTRRQTSRALFLGSLSDFEKLTSSKDPLAAAR